MKNLRITSIQTTLIWEDIAANLEHFSQKIDTIKERTNLIVLPEMFSTGFSMTNEEIAEDMGGQAMRWMKHQANSMDCVITGSLIIKENGKRFNRLIWMRPDGSYETYDKRHLFTFAGEDEYFTAGESRLIVELNGWRICPLVCYDLRFPVWSRNCNLESSKIEAAYDCLIYIANWPEARRAAWNSLLLARAHENQAYVVGVNRIGEDANGIKYSGDTSVIDPKGNLISSTQPFCDTIETTELNWEQLVDYRNKFPAIADADRFNLL